MTEATFAKIAEARVDDLLNKVFVVGVALLTVDVVLNAAKQIQYLNPFWFWSTFSLLIASVVGSILAAYKFGNTRYWYRAMIFTVLFTALTWNFQLLEDVQLPADYKPWIWWAVGPTIVSSAGAFQKRWAYLTLVAGPLVWLLVETNSHNGALSLGTAIEDSLYTFFFTMVISLMVIALRERARDVDRENGKALNAILERTRVAVLNRERAKYNSILHDQVLETLELAADASNEKLRGQAANKAELAIARIELEFERGPNPSNEYSFETMAQPLEDAIKKLDGEIKVTIAGSSTLQMPYQAAAAIWEATLLAVTNSLKHAPGASSREVKLQATTKGFKFVVTDNGRGFRMSNVHKTALGVRWTMFKRLESVGIKPNLHSQPGNGTTWIFEWQP